MMQNNYGYIVNVASAAAFVGFPFLQGRRKRSGWSGFGRTNIEGESGRVRIAAVAARAIVTQRCTKLKQRSFFAKQRLGNFNSGPD